MESNERFWSHVEMIPFHQCWEWTGTTLKRQGYGRLQVDGRSFQAHRYSWMLHNGPIPEGLLVCHHCDNKACVRPDHLFIGTTKDNALDASRKGLLDGHPKPKTVCPHGHSLTADNVLIRRTPRRRRPYQVCRACHYEIRRRYRARLDARRYPEEP